MSKKKDDEWSGYDGPPIQFLWRNDLEAEPDPGNPFTRRLDEIEESDGSDQEAVLYLGEKTVPFPASLLSDHELSEKARMVWCYLRGRSMKTDSDMGHVCITEMSASFRLSRQALHYLMLELRITRWIAVRQKRAGPNGAIRRNSYVLFDTPATVEQVLIVDKKYRKRLLKWAQSSRPRIANLSNRMLDALLHLDEPDPETVSLGRHGRVFLAGEGHERTSAQWEHVLQRRPPNPESEAPVSQEIHSFDWHEGILRFDNLERVLLDRVLERLPIELRQVHLDEIAVRVLRAEMRQGPHIKSPFRYLKWMVERYEAGGNVLTDDWKRLPEMKQTRELKARNKRTEPLRLKIQELQSSIEGNRRMLRMLGNIEGSEENVRWLEDDIRKKEEEIQRIRNEIKREHDHEPN